MRAMTCPAVTSSPSFTVTVANRPAYLAATSICVASMRPFVLAMPSGSVAPRSCSIKLCTFALTWAAAAAELVKDLPAAASITIATSATAANRTDIYYSSAPWAQSTPSMSPFGAPASQSARRICALDAERGSASNCQRSLHLWFKGCVTDYRQFAVASNSASDATQMVSIHTNPEASGPCARGAQRPNLASEPSPVCEQKLLFGGNLP